MNWNSWRSVAGAGKDGATQQSFTQPWEVRLATFPCIMATWEAAGEVEKGDEEIGWGPWGKWLGKRGKEFRKELSGNKKTVSVLVERQEEEQINLEVQKCFNKIQKEQANEFCKAAGSQPGHRLSQSDPQLGHRAGNEHQLSVLVKERAQQWWREHSASRNSSALNVRCSVWEDRTVLEGSVTEWDQRSKQLRDYSKILMLWERQRADSGQRLREGH